MVVLREYHSSEKDFILNYLKGHQPNISEHIEMKKLPSIDEVLRSQLKMFPIPGDQVTAGKIDISPNDTPPNTSDKSTVIETKIRGILANKQPTDFAVKMFEPLNKVVHKPKPITQSTTRASNVKPHIESIAVNTKTVKPRTGSTKVQKSVQIKTPDAKTQIETKLAGVVKREKPLRPKAKFVAKAIITSDKGTAKITRPPLQIKARPLKPNLNAGKIKKVKIEKAPKVVKQGSVSFPRLVKLEKPVPKTVQRKKLVGTPVVKKVAATKPQGIQIKIA